MNTVANILKARPTLSTFKASTSLRIFSLAATQPDNSKNVEIIIPKRIPRGPTDILRALESTISRDLTAPHYKYHDDPYMIPMSNVGKRTFALAYESGRKTAHWIRAQHANLFQHKECDPPIEMFFPKMVYNEKSDVTEADLKRAIDHVLVLDAIVVYKLLKGKGLELEAETKQAFLDLLCFYNHEESLSEDFIEERWYRKNAGKEKARKTWKDGDLAEELFISMDSPNAEVYSSLISGMAKHYQIDRAYQLFQEAQEKQLVLSTNAYNSIIRVSNFLKESFDLRWSFVIELLTLMAAAKVQPNLGTLNAVLEVLSTMGTNRNTRLNALRIIKEFTSLGIQPSLATWYLLLITYCKERAPTSFILRDILPYIENKEHEICDLRDTNFFVTAMDICRNHLHDKNLGLRVDRMLHYGNNYDLIGDSFKESIYYRHYFMLMCDTTPFDEFMSDVYEKLVPHIYVPEPSVMTQILRCVEMNSAITYLPKLWSDMTVFDHTDREALLTAVLNIMVTNKPDDGSKHTDQFANIAWGVWNKIANQNENRIQKLAFTGEMLGQILTVVLWNNDLEKASIVMNKLDKDIHSVVGVPKIEALSLYIDHCISNMAPTKAVECIQYCADNGFPESQEFALRVQKSLTLDQFDSDKLSKIVGFVFNTNHNTKSSDKRKEKRKWNIAKELPAAEEQKNE